MNINRIGLFSLPRAGMRGLEGVEYARSLGVRLYEPLAVEGYPTEDDALRLRDRAAELGMTMPCLSTAADLNGADRREQAAELKRLARMAAKMNIPLLHHTLLPELDCEKPRLPFGEVLERVLPLAREVFDEAAALGVRCVYEGQGLYFNGCERFGEFLDRLERPAGVVLDTGNVCFAGEDAARFAEVFADRIAHVHVKDFAFSDEGGEYRLAGGRWASPAVLGEGDLPVAECMAILRRIGYKGSVMLEHGVSEAEQRRCLRALEEML